MTQKKKKKKVEAEKEDSPPPPFLGGPYKSLHINPNPTYNSCCTIVHVNGRRSSVWLRLVLGERGFLPDSARPQ